jgi:hypothetical protein
VDPSARRSCCLRVQHGIHATAKHVSIRLTCPLCDLAIATLGSFGCEWRHVCHSFSQPLMLQRLPAREMPSVLHLRRIDTGGLQSRALCWCFTEDVGGPSSMIRALLVRHSHDSAGFVALDHQPEALPLTRSKLTNSVLDIETR